MQAGALQGQSARSVTDGSTPAARAAGIQHAAKAAITKKVAPCTDTRYNRSLIRSIKHRGLKRRFARDDSRGVAPDQLARLEGVLSHLDAARAPQDLALPGYRLHPLKSPLIGFWSVSVSRNWRVVFRFDGGDVFDVDLVDYH